MWGLRGLFLSVILISTASAWAGGNTCCLCQTGEDPSYERFVFGLGCDLWLTQQKGCDWSQERKIQRDGTIELPDSCAHGTLKLGYVGHWGSSGEMSDFLRGAVFATQSRYDVSVDVDNSACLAMNSPEDVLATLSEHPLPPGKYIRVIGNQVVSIGMWQTFVSGKPNLYAITDTRNPRPIYPDCTEFEYYGCSSEQDREVGKCVDPRVGLRELECCPGIKPLLRTAAPRDRQGKEQKPAEEKVPHSWVDRDSCRG